MENKNLKNEVKEVAVAEKKVVRLSDLNLDKKQLVVEDVKLAEICLKPFSQLSGEEIAKLHLCKAKVVKIESNDRYSNKKSIRYKAMMILVDGIIFEKYLSEEELLVVQNFNPELITDGKSQVYVPVKLMTSIAKTGDRIFRYLACLSPDVYMGVSRKTRDGRIVSDGIISNKSVNNIISFNLSNKDKAIKFVDMDNEKLENSIIVIADVDNYSSIDEF